MPAHASFTGSSNALQTFVYWQEPGGHAWDLRVLGGGSGTQVYQDGNPSHGRGPRVPARPQELALTCCYCRAPRGPLFPPSSWQRTMTWTAKVDGGPKNGETQRHEHARVAAVQATPPNPRYLCCMGGTGRHFIYSYNFWRNVQSVFYSSYTMFSSHQLCMRVSTFPHPHQRLLFSIYKHYHCSHPSGYKVVSQYDFDLHLSSDERCGTSFCMLSAVCISFECELLKKSILFSSNRFGKHS